MKNENKINFFGVQVDNVTLADVLVTVREFFNSHKQQHIVTVNPEFIIRSEHDDEFRNILNKADLSVADGFGIKLFARRFGAKLRERITGVDLMDEMCHIAAVGKHPIFLLGAKKGVAEAAAFRLIERHPGLMIVGAESGYRGWHRKVKDNKLVELINRRRPAVLFVAFGQVKQEKWIYYNLPKMPTVKVAMGVGGAFDYISGRVSRAPRWLRAIGLEWLYRVVRQPWRLPRIITAVIIFGWHALRHRKHEVQ